MREQQPQEATATRETLYFAALRALAALARGRELGTPVPNAVFDKMMRLAVQAYPYDSKGYRL